MGEWLTSWRSIWRDESNSTVFVEAQAVICID